MPNMKAAPKLTDSRIAALKPRQERYEVWAPNGGGFGVRVSPRGVKSFVLLYRRKGGGGKARRLTLGNYPAMSLADANLAASNAHKALERGEDPAATKVTENRADRAAKTIAQLAADYLERHARPKKRSAAEDERRLNKDVLPFWRDRKVKAITLEDCVELLDRVTDRGAPVSANRLHALLVKLFKFARKRGVIKLSPYDATAGAERPHTERPRKRELSAEEIAIAWAALDRSTMEQNLRRAARLKLTTAQRRAEVLGMQESEIDRSAALWTIPGARTKNGHAHIVPLSPLALEIIGPPPKAGEGEEADKPRWTFPSPRTGEPYRGPSLDHAVRDLFIPRERSKNRKSRKQKGAPIPPLANVALLMKRDALEVKGKREGDPEWEEITKQIDAERWTPHDLRRTAATRMRELGITRDDVKLVLNHTDPSVTGRVYDQWHGLAEKRRALAAWAVWLERIISGETQAPELRRA
jgi:integrase